MKASRRPNWKLWAGIGCTVLVLVAALFGPWLAPYGEDEAERVLVVQTPEGSKTVFPPQPPSWRHPLGTDRWGYDLLSLILYGARFTIFGAFAVALARVIVGGLLGIGAGLRASQVRRTGRLTLISAIPAFLVVYLAMAGITINPTAPVWQLVLVQASLMTLVGIPAVLVLVREKTFNLRRRPFVDAASALGAGKAWIGTKHVLPMLREDLMLLVLNETILALNLMGQLGIFQLFFGGTEQSVDPPLFYSITHEWAGLIGQARAAIQANQWMVLAPMGAFVFAVLSLFLLLRGMEEHFRSSQTANRFM